MSVTFLNPFILGAESSGGAGTYKATVTIASGTVGSSLTDFPVMVRLSDMPAGFWSHVKEDGGDIRVKTTGGTLVPMDLVRLDYESQDGVLFFLASSVASGSVSSWDIHYGDDALNLLAVDDANGRNAVWAAYECVFLLGGTAGDDRTGGAQAQLNGDMDLFEQTSTSPDVDSHQGICWDGTYYYTTDTNAIYKWDASWTLVDSNTDAISDAAIGGTPTVIHCGDLDVHDGKLYIPMECWPASGGLYNGHIGVFNAGDLSFIEAFDISAQAHESASIAYCDRDGLLYVVDFDGHHSTIYQYDPADGSYQGSLTTDHAITGRQGITWWRGYFWVSGATSKETWRVTFDGATTMDDSGGGGGVGFGQNQSGDYEGIGHTKEELLQLIDGGTAENVQTWRPRDHDLCAGGGAANVDLSNMRAVGRASLQTYTMGVSAALSAKAQNRTCLSYWDESAGSTNTRQVFAYRLASASLAIWDVNNSWLDASPALDPVLNTFYRMHAVYQGTTSRKFYVNGALKSSQSAITAVPATLDTLMAFQEDASQAEAWTGQAGFIYLYPGVLSADWIAAEYLNLNAPGSFYSVGAETSV